MIIKIKTNVYGILMYILYAYLLALFKSLTLFLTDLLPR